MKNKIKMGLALLIVRNCNSKYCVYCRIQVIKFQANRLNLQIFISEQN